MYHSAAYKRQNTVREYITAAAMAQIGLQLQLQLLRADAHRIWVLMQNPPQPALLPPPPPPIQAPPIQAPPIQAPPILAPPIQPPPIQAPPVQAHPIQAPPIQPPPIQAPAPPARRRRRPRIPRQLLNPLGLTPHQVLQLYRLDMQTILHLVNDLMPDLTPNSHNPTSIPPLIKVTAVLQFLATGSYQHTTGSVHGLAQATFCKILTQVLNALHARVHQHISMPRGVAAITAAKTAFHAISGFPNVIGCIDCTHVPLVPPSANREAYRNRKGQLTMNIQMVSDAHMCIINLCARFPGSCHDARILRASRLYDTMENMPRNTWLLGDSGYPLMSWLMTPLRQPQTRGERRYNRAHIQTRNIVERTFGLLKARFRCLHRTGGALMYKPEKVALIICACVILHNICVRRNVPMPEPDDDQHDSSDSDDDQDGGDGVPVPRRQPLGLAHDIRQRLCRNVFA